MLNGDTVRKVIQQITFFTIYLLAFASFAVSEGGVSDEVIEETEILNFENEIIVISEDVSFPSWVDEEALAENYIYKIMPHPIRFMVTRLSGASLSEPNRSLYWQVKDLIGKVAAGEVNKTDFLLPFEDVFQNTFTAAEMAEMSVDAIVEDGKITSEAKEAALGSVKASLASISAKSVIQCLLNDCPYELYWYAKSGGGTEYGYKIKSYNATDKYITVNGEIIFNMSVSSDYSIYTENEGVLTYAQYETDSTYGTSVAAAAENASQILAEYQDRSDYEKLKGYKDSICELTDYNYDASGKNYGNPWQLIWVFDGDEETKVVCEGYAKAFQYLAGLGTEKATVICAQGYINSISSSNAHMWNITDIDGHNYLVDVTACDSGGDYFLRGYTDGDLSSGYKVGSRSYIYSGEQSWSSEELTLTGYDYSDWVTATTTAPSVTVSSDTAYPGYQIALQLEGDVVPVEKLLASIDGEKTEILLGDNVGYISVAGNTEISFLAVVDGMETPSTDPVSISLSSIPENNYLYVPAGSGVESEAFSGIAAEMVYLDGNDVAAGAFTECPDLKLVIVDESSILEEGAFEEETVLAVRAVGDWFDSGYKFIVAKDE